MNSRPDMPLKSTTRQRFFVSHQSASGHLQGDILAMKKGPLVV